MRGGKDQLMLTWANNKSDLREDAVNTNEQ
jgi:hypothetical protein